MNTPPESTQTQCERLLEHLKLGLPLTAHKALYGYSCLRLAARIHDLKQMGHQIEPGNLRHAHARERDLHALTTQRVHIAD